MTFKKKVDEYSTVKRGRHTTPYFLPIITGLPLISATTHPELINAVFFSSSYNLTRVSYTRYATRKNTPTGVEIRIKSVFLKNGHGNPSRENRILSPIIK